MFDYKAHFDDFTKENGLNISLSFDMPDGFETANGMYDPDTKIIHINKEFSESLSDCEKAFVFFHELRHAYQYEKKDRFCDLLAKSMDYVIQYDGQCFKKSKDGWLECKLEGTEEYFSDVYKCQLYEADANQYGYDMSKRILGDSPELREIYLFYALPKNEIPYAEFDKIYALIDARCLPSD